MKAQIARERVALKYLRDYWEAQLIRLLTDTETAKGKIVYKLIQSKTL